jgi:hypothetical protein
MVFRPRPRRPSHATVVAYLALFVALGGTAVAAGRLPRGSVGTAQLRDGAVATRKIHPGAITASKVARDALTGAQIREATLGTVPRATRAALATRASGAAKADDAALLKGLPPTAYRDACPPLYARVNSLCYESAAEPAATWAAAARACAQAGKRLPDAGELQVAYERLPASQAFEWTSTVWFGQNGATATMLASDAQRGPVLNADGVAFTRPYRCFSNGTD